MSTRTLLLAALLLGACNDAAAPAPEPSVQARVVDAAAELTAAAAAAQRAGYQVFINVTVVDSLPPKIGVLLFPR